MDWVTGLLRHMQATGTMRAEATPEAEAEWSAHIEELAAGMLYTQVDSWATGINSNVEGKTVRRILQYRAARRSTGRAAMPWRNRAMPA